MLVLAILIIILGIVFLPQQIFNSGFYNSENKDGTLNEIQEQIKIDWRDAELIDVKTGEKFKVSDFKGKPILLESFAVWCPICTKQQYEIKKLHDILGDSFISISLDTDPNEDAEKVKEHIEKNGFNWYYVISPSEVTQSLIDEFGVDILNAPSTPVVYINENFEVRLLERGVKTTEELKKELKL